MVGVSGTTCRVGVDTVSRVGVDTDDGDDGWLAVPDDGTDCDVGAEVGGVVVAVLRLVDVLVDVDVLEDVDDDVLLLVLVDDVVDEVALVVLLAELDCCAGGGVMTVVMTVGSPFGWIDVSSEVMGTAGARSPGLSFSDVAGPSRMSVALVSVYTRPPASTITVARAAPKITPGRRYQGSGAAARAVVAPVGYSRSNSISGRAAAWLPV